MEEGERPAILLFSETGGKLVLLNICLYLLIAIMNLDAKILSK